MSEMTINWFSDGERVYIGDITRCVKYKDQINILFETEIESDPVEGRVSINISNEDQETEGVWIYPDTEKEKARFSEIQENSEENPQPYSNLWNNARNYIIVT